MKLTEFLDIYCERTGPELWSEPVNFLTNGFFLLAAFCLARVRKGSPGVRGRDTLYLVCLVGAVGIGSALFHSFAMVWAAALDLGAIALLALSIFFLWMRNILGMNTLLSFLGLFLLALLTVVFIRSVELGGSETYLSCVIALAAISVSEISANGDRRVLYATLVFVVALFARTIDQHVCSWLPIGTHFLWHSFNALTLFLLVSAYFRRIEGQQSLS